MTLPQTGALSLQDIALEFEDTAPHRLTEFYRGGVLVPENNTRVPVSGPLKLSDFYGGVNELAVTVSDAPSLSLDALFGNDWNTVVPKRLIIPVGVVVGPVVSPAGRAGTLRIDNAGEIQGSGGASNGGHGGIALKVHGDFYLNNTGAIRGGGGGGGRGGMGSPGSVTRREPVSGDYFDDTGTLGQPGYLRSTGGITRWSTSRWINNTANPLVIGQYKYWFGTLKKVVGGGVHRLYGVYRTWNEGTPAGIGGNGGVGRGYGQGQTAGQQGQYGGTNSGRGGDGGRGGTWGEDGVTGQTAQSGGAGLPGGLSGSAIHIIGGNITFVERGTLQGPITALG